VFLSFFLFLSIKFHYIYLFLQNHSLSLFSPSVWLSLSSLPLSLSFCCLPHTHRFRLTHTQTHSKLFLFLLLSFFLSFFLSTLTLSLLSLCPCVFFCLSLLYFLSLSIPLCVCFLFYPAHRGRYTHICTFSLSPLSISLTQSQSKLLQWLVIWCSQKLCLLDIEIGINRYQYRNSKLERCRQVSLKHFMLINVVSFVANSLENFSSYNRNISVHSFLWICVRSEYFSRENLPKGEGSGTVFKTLHLLHNLRMVSIS